MKKNKKKKIFVICPEISGNPFTRTLPLLRALKRDYDFIIIGPIKNKPYVWDDSINARFINTYSSLPPGLRLLHTIFKIINFGLKEDFKIIIGFKLLPQIVIPGLILRRLKKKKFVLDIDDLEKELTESRLKKYLINYCEKNLNKVDKIITSSRFLEKKFKGVFVPSCVDKKWAQNIDKNLYKNLVKKYGLKNKIIVGYIGAFRKHKGLDILIKAVKLANIKNLKLILVGDGPNKEELKKLAGKETIFAGFVSHDKLQTYFKIIDIFVIPNIYSKVSKAQTPVKLFEAMACKKAIIATKTSGMPKMLSNSGIIVNPSEKEIAESIKKLAKSRKLINKLGNKAYKLFLKKYNLEVMRKKILDVLGI